MRARVRSAISIVCVGWVVVLLSLWLGSKPTSDDIKPSAKSGDEPSLPALMAAERLAKPGNNAFEVQGDAGERSDRATDHAETAPTDVTGQPMETDVRGQGPADSTGEGNQFASATVIEQRETPSERDDHIRRIKLIETDFKYPLLRVEETLGSEARRSGDRGDIGLARLRSLRPEPLNHHADEGNESLKPPVDAPPQGARHVIEQTAMVADHVLVRFKPDTPETEVIRLAERHGGFVRRKMLAPDTYLIAFENPALDTVPTAVAAFEGEKDWVVYAEPDYVTHPLGIVPDDPLFDQLWGLRNPGGLSGVAGTDIGATSAWNISRGSTNILVAVLDTGIDYDHEDLAANIWINPAESGPLSTNLVDDSGNGFVDDWRGWDFYNNDNDPMDDHGHGTHAAGIIGAVGNNALGTVGVCWNIRLVGLKILSSSGALRAGAVSDAIDAVYYGVGIGARILSNSWGVDDRSQTLADAIAYADAQDVIFVAAAGNNGTDNDTTPRYPAAYPHANVITVAAGNRFDELADYSNYGSNTVHLVAPGSQILSTAPTAIEPDGYKTDSGTSMAVPYVTGAAALLLAHNPDLGAVEVKAALMNTVTTNAAYVGKVASGGRLNLDQAIRNVAGLYFDRRDYSAGDWAVVTLVNTNLSGLGTQAVSLSSGQGDAETLLLHESEAAGSFTNAILIAYASEPVVGNELLEGVHNTPLTVTYTNSGLGVTNLNVAHIDLGLTLTIDPPPAYVPQQMDQISLNGVVNGHVQVDMVVSNAATGDAHAYSATETTWSAPSVMLADGNNTIWVTGVNAYGHTDSRSVTVTRVGPSGSTNHVSLTGGHVWPFTSSANAATNLQAAIDAAYDGNEVLIADGVYPIEAPVLVDKAVTVRGANGRETVTIDGGGSHRCFTATHPDARLEGLTIQGGNASEGAGVYLRGGGTVADCLIEDNEADFGGGVYAFQGGVVSNSIVTGNFAEYGGGVYLYRGGLIIECDISDNQAAEYGGGVFADHGQIVSSQITSSFANAGGGLFLIGESMATNCVVTGNATVLVGGGACLVNGATITHSEIVSNGRALRQRSEHTTEWLYTRQGGGLWMHNNAVAEQCAISNNQARQGGGAHLSTSSVIRNSSIVSNKAESSAITSLMGGGGLSLESGSGVVNSHIVSNFTDWHGGGIQFDGLDEGVWMRNCLITENQAGSETGSSILGGGIRGVGYATVENCTIVGNRAWFGGGGMHVDSRCETVNTIVRHNTALRDDNYSGGAYAYCNTWPLPDGPGNITNNPKFVSTSLGDYRLAPGSPSIDSGTNLLWMVGATDLAGRNRILNDRVDMGAYEHIDAFEVIIATPQEGAAPFAAVLDAILLDQEADTFHFAWDINNDGTNEFSGFGLATITNVFLQPGVYDVRVTVSNHLGETIHALLPEGVAVGAPDVYVSLNGQHLWPFTNWVSAATNIQAAVDAGSHGSRVHIESGVYEITEQIHISKGLHILGQGDAGTVIVDALGNDRCLWMSHPDAVVSNVTLSRGELSDGSGGAGVFIDDGGQVIDCIVRDNKTRRTYLLQEGAFHGGGILVYKSGEVTRCIITDNESRGLGGGVFLFGGGRVEMSTLSGNLGHAQGTWCGHAVAVRHDGEIIACNISSNLTGGVDLRYGGRLVNSVIRRNPGDSAVRVEDGAELRGCLIADNDGIGVHVGGSSDTALSVVSSCTIARNSVGYERHSLPWGHLKNTIVSANVERNISNSQRLTLEHCYVGDAAEFIDETAGNYRLTPMSPAFNTGTNRPWMAQAKDLDGNDRIRFDIVDIGAYELPDSLSCGLVATPSVTFARNEIVFEAHVAGSDLADLYYGWDFTGDGSIDIAGLDLAIVTNDYEHPGIYSVSLVVTNSAGEVATHLRNNYITIEGFDQFRFDPLPDTQTAGVPFEVTITAEDSQGLQTTSFSNTVQLTGMTQEGNVSISPTTIEFSEGLWSGWVTVDTLEENVHLRVDEVSGISGQSTSFDVTHGALDHFTWSDISSPQSAGVPFDVTIQARDPRGYPVNDFSSIVSLHGLNAGLSEHILLADSEWDGSGSGSLGTRGFRFSLENDIYVTHVRSFWGSKVSLWKEDGELLFSQSVDGANGFWNETALDESILLRSGSTYRLAAYTDGNMSYWKSHGTPSGFSHGTIVSGCFASGDVFPDGESPHLFLVDLRYCVATRISVSPDETTNFSGGLWSGQVSVLGTATNMFLRAEDDHGHTGDSDVFRVDIVAVEVESEHGHAEPGPGTHYYALGEEATFSITNGTVQEADTLYICKGWQGTGDVSSGEEGLQAGPYTLERDSSITWLWHTNYWLELDVGPASVDVTNGWYAGGTVLVAHVEVPEGQVLDSWSGTLEGCIVDGHQITIPMDRPRSLQAHIMRTFYVNDSATNLNAWCTEPGDDANDGLTPATPKATVQALLAAYDLVPGDTVRIDTGQYDLSETGNIVVGSQHQGSSDARLVFEASPYGVTFDRNNTDSGSYVWHISGAEYVTLRTAQSDAHPDAPQRWMRLTGAGIGIYVRGAHGRLERLDAVDNLHHGINIGSFAPFATVENCLARGSASTTSGTGIFISSTDATVRNCTVADNGQRGIYITATRATLHNNIVQADGPDRYAIYRWSTSHVLTSDHNNLYAINGAHVGYSGANRTTLAEWRSATDGDANTLARDPLFVDPATGDFHLQSTAGSYHNGAWTADAADSPGIDTGVGDAGAEPEPNTTPLHATELGMRNLGAYGGTEQASKTPANRRVWLYEPLGGETYLNRNEPVTVRWTRAGTNWQTVDTVRLAYSADSGASWHDLDGASAVSASDGEFSWDVSGLAAGLFYRVRVTCNEEETATDASSNDFRIGADLVFYVNDASTNLNAWCTEPGDDANDGLTPATPKATVQALLAAYDLGPGDTVRIDTGQYDLSETGNIVVENQHQGSNDARLVFEASPYGVTFDRGSTASGSYAWHISGANHVMLRTAQSDAHPDAPQRWMRVTGASFGVYVRGAYCRLKRLDAADNLNHGINISYFANFATVENCLARGSASTTSGTGIFISSADATVRNCTVADNGKRGIYIDATRATLQNNIVQINGPDRYAIYRRSTSHVLTSDYNNLHAVNGAHVGYSGANRTTLAEWRSATDGDANTLARDPLFVDPATGDFHLQSTAGSYHNGAWTADTADSPGIDTGVGDAGGEPEPNTTPLHGADMGMRNLGAYGGTEQASQTPANRRMWLYEPLGGETYLNRDEPVTVRWTWAGTSWGAGDTLMLEYSADSGASWYAMDGASAVSASDGEFSWDISGLAAGPFYRVRVTCNEEETATDASSNDFRVGETLIFYVNDATTNLNAWSTEPGDDTNDGLTPATPKATVQAILAAYDLHPGDTVRIDTGQYDLSETGNIVVGNRHGGTSANPVVFEASPYGVTFDRGHTDSGSYVWHINGADYVTLRTAQSDAHPAAPQRWMRVTGANVGIYVRGRHCRLERLDVTDNNLRAIGIHGRAGEHATVENCLARGSANATSGTGIFIGSGSADVTVRNCTVAGNAKRGLYIDATRATLHNNIVQTEGAGRYAIYRSSTRHILTSDYNNLYAVNGAHVGYSGANRTTLAEWQSATGQDTNSMSVDPAFAHPEAGRFHLKSWEGRYKDGQWVSDTAHSPCIDAGDPESEWANEPDPNGGRINMGTYGNTELASKSLTNTAHTIEVISTHGEAVPPVGEHLYYDGTERAFHITPEAYVVGSTQYVYTGWSLVGVSDTNGYASGSATEVGFVVTNNAVLTWHWTTNHWVHHFEWDPIPTQQVVNEPFDVTLRAKDVEGSTVTGFVDDVGIEGLTALGTNDKSMLDGVMHNTTGSANNSRGLRFSVDSDLTITHVRHYWGLKLSLWTDDQVLLLDMDVSSISGTWVETVLEEPIRLNAGETYRIAAYGDGSWMTTYRASDGLPRSFNDGTIISSCWGSGDSFPANEVTSSTELIDFLYVSGHSLSLEVAPTNTGTFAEGVWSGTVTVQEQAFDMFLRADDGEGRTGDSNPFDTLAYQRLTVASEHGGADPSGTNEFLYGTVVNCMVTNSPVYDGVLATQYVCVASSVIGNDYTQISPTNVTLTLTNDATLVWQWTTNYWLSVEAADGGAHGGVMADSGWQPADSMQEIVAIPSNYYHFAQWTGDTDLIETGAAGDPVVTARMERPAAFIGHFAPDLAPLGTPHYWLARHGLTEGGFAAAELRDSDGDGMANWQEYVADTCPTNAASVLRLNRLEITPEGWICVNWQGGVQARQILERSDDLTRPNRWQAIFTNDPPTEIEVERHDTSPPDGTSRFYRIQAERP